MLLPMWACRPTRSMAGEAHARSAASAAAPLARPKPNLESSWPVITYSWVWASTPGVTRSSTRGRGAPRATRFSMRSSSSKLSATTRPTPDSRA